MDNPFFIDYKQPYDAVPFSKFKAEHFIPAVEKSIELALVRIDDIVKKTDSPNFENTIVFL